LAVIRIQDGVARLLGREVRVRSLKVVAGRSYWMRTRVRGIDQTHLDVRVWRVGTRQPTRWAVSRIDRRPASSRGRAGLRMTLAPNAGRAAVRLGIDDVRVRRAQAIAAIADAD